MSSPGGKHIHNSSSPSSSPSKPTGVAHAKFVPAPGVGDVVNQMSTGKPVNHKQMKASPVEANHLGKTPHKTMAIVNSFYEKPMQFHGDVALIKQKSTDMVNFNVLKDRASGDMTSPLTSDSEKESSLVSKGSLAEFDKPFYSHNDGPARVPLKRYVPKRVSSPGFDVSEFNGPAFASSIFGPQSITFSRANPISISSQQPQLYHEEIEIFGWLG